MDFITEILLYGLFLAYSAYAQVLKVFAWVFMPVTKWYIERKVESVGLKINGKRPIDPKILDDKVYLRAVTDWSLGILEAIVDKQIHIEDLTGCFEKVLLSKKFLTELEHPLARIFQWFNLQTPSKAWEVGHEHYDLGVDLWEPMLGKYMQYSCGYWKNAKNMDEAQEAKLHMIAQKLKLQPGMKVLDIGCGWGGLAKFLTTHYGVTYVGYTISKVQKEYCDKACQGLPVEIRLADYRTINDKFDRAVSVGMFEHVGARNYRDYFATVNRVLKDDGLFLLHTMGISHHTTPHNTLFIHKYIFKNGYFPHHTQIAKSIEELFIIEDWHNFGYDYYLTYKAYSEGLAKHWPKLEAKYGERFCAIWKVHLHLFEGLWRSRAGQLWQIVLSKEGVRGGYESIRP